MMTTEAPLRTIHWSCAALMLALPSTLLAGNVVDCPTTSSSTLREVTHDASRGGLVFHANLVEFQQAGGNGLPLETFTGGSVTEPGDGEGDCVEPVGAQSDDQCYSPGDLIEGFGLTSTSGGGYVVLGDDHPQVGQDGLAVGPMDIITQQHSNVATIISFEEDDVTAVGVDVIPGCNGLDVIARVYDHHDNLLGSTTISLDASWHSGFLGLTTPTPVQRIELATNPSGGQLIQDLRFGPNMNWLFRDRFETP